MSPDSTRLFPSETLSSSPAAALEYEAAKRRAKSILIVEDQLMIADMTEHFLLQHGYEICGIARTVDEAVAFGLRYKPDIAILDLRLADGGLGTQVAAQLGSLHKLGVLYVTGNISEVVLTLDQGHACLKKPYRLIDLLQAIQIVTDLVDNGFPSMPSPRGFRLLAEVATV